METSAGPAKATREGSAAKRAAVLGAARDLFVADGFERTSMDAVARRANVSKRTVYDYFGDKRTLLLAVGEGIGESLFDSLRSAIQTYLSDGVGIATVPDLESALIAFAVEVTTSTVGSSDYVAYITLLTTEGANMPEWLSGPMNDAPEEAIAERFAHFAAAGLMSAPNPRLAADHFNALTILLAFSSGPGVPPEKSRATIEHSITEGVRAFLRAYAAT